MTERVWCAMGASAFAAPTTRVRAPPHEMVWSPPIWNTRAPPMATASEAAVIAWFALTLSARFPPTVADCVPLTVTWWTVPTMSLRVPPMACVSAPTTPVILSFSVRSL